jgi:hypothetical protein
LNAAVDEENGSSLSRITCGWKKAHLPLESVRRYWRDVHSPAISRRAGLYEYRHAQFESVRADLFAPTQALDYRCPAAEQLMWLSDVRYFDDAGLAAFGESPDAAVRAHLLADIDILVDKSTTYRAVGRNAWTYKDATGEPAPAGAPDTPTYAVFFRQRAADAAAAARDEAAFRECVRSLAVRWSELPGVRRLRLSVFDVPDMEAERKAGYPIKTHPVEQQYQALIDLVLEAGADARTLISNADAEHLGVQIKAVHAYPVASLYTFVRGGRPTLIGLRGYPAYQAIREFDAAGQRQSALLKWMYGAVASRPPVDSDS